MESPVQEEGKKLILFADGNRALLETARRIFDPGLYEFQGVGSGIEALCRIAERRPAFVFADRNCPELNGFQLCVLLQEHEEYRDIPVVLLSDRQDIFEQVKAEALGASCLLVKPFGRAELLELVKGGRADAA